MERLDYRLLEEETETVLGFARHGPGFRYSIEEGFIQKQRQSKCALGGMDSSEQLDDLPVHITPNHPPPKMEVLPKTFLQTILCKMGSAAFNPNQSGIPANSKGVAQRIFMDKEFTAAAFVFT